MAVRRGLESKKVIRVSIVNDDLSAGSVLLSPEEVRSFVRAFVRDLVVADTVDDDRSVASLLSKLTEAAHEQSVQRGVFVSMEGMSSLLHLVHRVEQFAAEFDSENCDFLKTRRMWRRVVRALPDAESASRELTARFATELEGADV